MTKSPPTIRIPEGPPTLKQLRRWREMLLAGQIQLRGLGVDVDGHAEGLRWIDEQLRAQGVDPASLTHSGGTP